MKISIDPVSSFTVSNHIDLTAIKGILATSRKTNAAEVTPIFRLKQFVY